MAVGVTDIRSTLAKRAAAAAERAAERARALTARLPEAKASLVRRGATHTWLFGSLARGDAAEESDVDLAVEGLPVESYFDALADLMRLFGVRVDLVRLEEAGDSLRACIREEGRPL